MHIFTYGTEAEPESHSTRATHGSHRFHNLFDTMVRYHSPWAGSIGLETDTRATQELRNIKNIANIIIVINLLIMIYNYLLPVLGDGGPGICCSCSVKDSSDTGMSFGFIGSPRAILSLSLVSLSWDSRTLCLSAAISF